MWVGDTDPSTPTMDMVTRHLNISVQQRAISGADLWLTQHHPGIPELKAHTTCSRGLPPQPETFNAFSPSLNADDHVEAFLGTFERVAEREGW